MMASISGDTSTRRQRIPFAKVDRPLLMAMWTTTAMLLVVTGCGSKEPQAAKDASPFKRVAYESLPNVGELITGLDEGRLSVAPPTNWFVFEEDKSKYLAKFSLFKRGDSPLPLIVVTVEDSPFAELQTVSEESLPDFALSMTEIVKEKGGKLLEPVRAMMIGDTPCIRYVKQVRLRFRVPKRESINGEQQIIQTLANGRLYTIDLRIRAETITKFRDHAYAVVANMKFSAPKAAGSK